ncbi:MAG: hypothetical protein RG741_00830 [Bacteroidales bacterium]|nr:hypothetical protein [Bacteroidales bacterium]
MGDKEKYSETARELKQMNSRLGDHQDDSGFRVPASYFDELPQTIGERIRQQQEIPASSFPWLSYKRLIPLVAGVLLLGALMFSLLLTDSTERYDDFYAMEQHIEQELFALYPGYEREFYYEVIMDSDITSDDILFELEFGIFDYSEDYEDLLELMFENAGYYGIDSRYLLSYLD